MRLIQDSNMLSFFFSLSFPNYSKQTIAITSRPRVTGGRKDTGGGRNRRGKAKDFLPPLQSLDKYTRVRVSLAPRQGSHHCFCQPQQETFKQEPGGITLISPGCRHLCLERKYLPPPPLLHQFHIH